LNHKKISKIGATRRQTLRLKCTKIDFGWPDPTGGAYSTRPDPLAVCKGPTSKGKEGRGREEGKGRAREGKRGEGERRGGETTLHTPCHKFLATPLAAGVGYRTLFRKNWLR